MNDPVVNILDSRYVPVAVETVVDHTALLVGVKFYQACQPAILDHSMEGRAMMSERMHIDEFKRRCGEAAVVYVLEMRRYDTDPDGVYLFRYSMSDRPLMTRLIDEVTVYRTHLNQSTFEPARPVRFMFLLPTASLEQCWGRDELARQLGEQLLQAIESATADPLPKFIRQEPAGHPAE